MVEWDIEKRALLFWIVMGETGSVNPGIRENIPNLKSLGCGTSRANEEDMLKNYRNVSYCFIGSRLRIGFHNVS